MQTLIVAVLLVSSFVCLGRPAEAITIEGVEFTDFLVFDAPPFGDLLLSTSEDIYVFAPDPIVAEVFDLTAGTDIIFSGSVMLTAETVSLCAQSEVCDTGPFTFGRDLVVNLPGPIGDLTLLAGGSIVVATQAIPEPSTALLLALGLGSIAGYPRGPRRCLDSSLRRRIVTGGGAWLANRMAAAHREQPPNKAMKSDVE
jgi:hypothetical protein